MNNLFKAMRTIDELKIGGVKESDTGREGIQYTIEEMTEMKLVCIKK